MTFIVALDGPAAAGKGTLGRGLAERFGFAWLDTGALYRATALRLADAGMTGEALDVTAAIEAARALDSEGLDDPALRRPEIGTIASQIARIAGVRAALLDFQRAFAQRPEGAILDGRDIGTVVCPDADVKIFVTASVEARARRRHAELVAAGAARRFDDVYEDVAARDEQDRNRAHSPLVPAADAHLLDTTNFDITTTLATAAALVSEALQAGGRTTDVRTTDVQATDIRAMGGQPTEK